MGYRHFNQRLIEIKMNKSVLKLFIVSIIDPVSFFGQNVFH